MLTADPSRTRAKVFLRYLIHAAKKHGIRQIVPKKGVVYTKREIEEKSNFLDKRAGDLTDERIKALETKINVHYTQNKYLPFEERLKSLRLRIYSLRRKKDAKKEKLSSLLSKIKSCEKLIKRMKTLDINEVDL
jgi:hypothetical protein